MQDMQDLKKKALTFRMILGLLKNGNKISNIRAKQFANYVRNELPNIGIIAEIATNLEKLSQLNEGELQILKEILAKYNFLPEDSEIKASTERDVSTSVTSNQKLLSNNILEDENRLKLSSTNSYRIIDLANSEQDFLDQYNMIFGGPVHKRQCILEYTKNVNGVQVVYKNYIFSSFEPGLKSYQGGRFMETALSREKVELALINSFGLISFDGEIFSDELKLQTLKKLCANHLVKLKRSNGTKVAFLRIGTISVKSQNALPESLDQYLVWSESAYPDLGTAMYLAYGNIDIERAMLVPKYANCISNTLLSEAQLRASRYIGTILGDNYIAKNNYLYGPSICTWNFPCKKDILRVLA